MLPLVEGSRLLGVLAQIEEDVLLPTHVSTQLTASYGETGGVDPYNDPYMTHHLHPCNPVMVPIFTAPVHLKNR